MIRSTADISFPFTFWCFHLGYTESGAGTPRRGPKGERSESFSH